MPKHITHIDGLKGICAIAVTVFHYLLAFAPFGYIGWESGVQASDRVSHFWSFFPFSVFTNADFPLHIFFAIIAFIPASRFFASQDKEFIYKQGIIRYFRFLPYVLASVLLSYFVYALGFYSTKELGDVLGNSWNLALAPKNYSLWDALQVGFLKAFVLGDDKYISPLWCMHIIFFGSYLSYITLLFFGNAKHRYAAYALIFLLTYPLPVYGFFVVGIVAADILHTYDQRDFSRFSVVLLIMGFLLSSFSKVTLPAAIFVQWGEALGALAILLACCFTSTWQKILWHPYLLWCGKYSFELILTHIVVAFTFSSWMFLGLYEFVGYFFASIITFLFAIPANMLAMLLFAKIVSPISEKLSRCMYVFFKQYR